LEVEGETSTYLIEQSMYLNHQIAEALRKKIVMCHFFAQKFSVDTKVLLQRVAKQITGPNALKLKDRIQETMKMM
jgi:hypothetical protein